jgi:hypothetical protein
MDGAMWATETSGNGQNVVVLWMLSDRRYVLRGSANGLVDILVNTVSNESALIT